MLHDATNQPSVSFGYRPIGQEQGRLPQPPQPWARKMNARHPTDEERLSPALRACAQRACHGLPTGVGDGVGVGVTPLGVGVGVGAAGTASRMVIDVPTG